MLALLCVLAMVLLMCPPGAFAVGTPIALGTVVDQNGNAVPGQRVELHSPNGVYSFNRISGIDGGFGFYSEDVDILANTPPSGTMMVLEVIASAGYNVLENNLQQMEWTGSTFAGSPFVLPVASAHKTVTGTVTKSDSGEPVQGVSIVGFPSNAWGVRSISATTDNNGEYSLSLQDGISSWSVQAEMNLADHNTDYLPISSPTQISFSPDTSAESATYNATVAPTNASISVRVLDQNGDGLTTQDFNGDCGIMSEDGNIGTFRKVNNNSELVNVGVFSGSYNFWCWHPALTGASFNITDSKFTVLPGEAKSLGTIQAVVNTAAIAGTVMDVNGTPLPGKNIVLMRQGMPDFIQARSDANGVYSATVGTGVWMVGMDQGGPGVQFDAYRPIAPRTVTISESEQIVSDADLVLEVMNQQLAGTVTDNNGNIISSFFGGVMVDTSSGSFFGGIDQSGQYQVWLPESVSGVVRVKVMTSPMSGYGMDGEQEVTIAGPLTTQNLTLLPYDATISGTLYDTLGNAIAGSGGTFGGGEGEQPESLVVIAVDPEGNLAFSPVGTDGSYRLSVLSGRDWNVTYQDERQSSEATIVSPLAQSNLISVGSGETVTADLVAFTKQATISGRVLYADGTAAVQVPVMASNIPILKNAGVFDPGDMVQVTSSTDALGDYTLNIPAGEFVVFAGMTPEMDATVIQPESNTALVGVGEDTTINLQYRTADATLSGTVYNTNGQLVTNGKVNGSSASGGFVRTEMGADGTYSLPVLSGENWKITVSTLIDSEVYALRNHSETPAVGTNSVDLTVEDIGINAPGGVTQTADVTSFITLTNDVGVMAQFMPFSLGSSGNVTVSLTPEVNLTDNETGSSASIGYDISARDSSGKPIKELDGPVKIIMPYDEAVLRANGIDESHVMTQNYSSNSGMYNGERMISTINTARNYVLTYSMHLSSFSVLGAATDSFDTAGVGSIAVSHQNGHGDYAVANTAGDREDSWQGYNPNLTGNFKSLAVDYNGDGIEEILTYPQTEGLGCHVRAFSMGPVTEDTSAAFIGLNNEEKGGCNLTAGDVNGDGTKDLIVTPMFKGDLVQTWTYDGESFNQADQWKPFGDNYDGRIDAAAGDIDGDGIDEIAVIPAKEAATNLRVYDVSDGVSLIKWRYAFARSETVGAQVEMGDVNGDGYAEIVTATVGDGRVRVFGLEDGELNIQNELQPFGTGYDKGISSALGDVNGDGAIDMVFAPTSGPTNLQVYTVNSEGEFDRINWAFAYGSRFIGETPLSMSVRDVDNDGDADVVVAPGKGGGPLVKAFTYNPDSNRLTLTNHFYAFSERDKGGVNVQVLRK